MIYRFIIKQPGLHFLLAQFHRYTVCGSQSFQTIVLIQLLLLQREKLLALSDTQRQFSLIYLFMQSLRSIRGTA